MERAARALCESVLKSESESVTAERQVKKKKVFFSLTPAAGLVLPAGWWLAGFGFLAIGSSKKVANYSRQDVRTTTMTPAAFQFIASAPSPTLTAMTAGPPTSSSPSSLP
jgi:hypothetical protein